MKPGSSNHTPTGMFVPINRPLTLYSRQPIGRRFNEVELKFAPITINLLHCKYPIVEAVARDVMGWKTTRNPSDAWDVLWSDAVGCAD